MFAISTSTEISTLPTEAQPQDSSVQPPEQAQLPEEVQQQACVTEQEPNKEPDKEPTLDYEQTLSVLLDSSNGDRDCEPLDPPGYGNNPHYSSTDSEVEPALVPQTATGLRYDQAAAELPHKPGWRVPRRRGRQRTVQLRSLSVPTDPSSDSDQHRRQKHLRAFTAKDQLY